MIAAAMEWFARFPALWAAAGIVCCILMGIATALTGFFVWRKWGPKTKDAAGVLVELQDRAVKLQESTLKMQKDHYENEVNYLKDQLTKVTEKFELAEKDHHAKKNVWNAEKIQLVGENEQLKARPDLGTLMDFEKAANQRSEKFFIEVGVAFKSQGETMQKMAQTLEHVATALTEHDRRIDERLTAVMEPVIEGINQGMQKVVEAIHANGKKT